MASQVRQGKWARVKGQGGASMQTLQICDVGLAADASHALHSMLKVIDGRAKASWQSGSIERADVLIAHGNCDPRILSAWAASGKPTVLVIDDRCSWPPAQFVLRHPFRVMQLLAMLDDVAEHLRAPQAPVAVEQSHWAAAESLRRLMSNAGERGWQMAQDADARVWIGDGQAHALPTTLQRLRCGRIALGAFGPTDETPPDGAQRLPVCDVAWFVGLHGATGLAPWLVGDASYRLRRWPDFGRLGVHPDLIELSAIAAARAGTPAALAQRSGLATVDVHRFLAAASLAGLLATAARVEAVPAVAVAPAPASGWARFVGDLRRHLRRVA